MERVYAYLVDWTITDKGRPVPYRDLDRKGRIDTLRNMDDDDFDEVVDAVNQHIAAVQEARDAEKKSQAGGNTSPANSPSADGSASRSEHTTTSTPTSTPSV